MIYQSYIRAILNNLQHKVFFIYPPVPDDLSNLSFQFIYKNLRIIALAEPALCNQKSTFHPTPKKAIIRPQKVTFPESFFDVLI